MLPGRYIMWKVPVHTSFSPPDTTTMTIEEPEPLQLCVEVRITSETHVNLTTFQDGEVKVR
jgi:hypothetical protein